MTRALLTAALSLLLPVTAFAQLSLGTSEPLSLSISPTYPRPGSTVTVSPVSNQIAFANSTMTVAVNGKQTYSGATHAVQALLAPVGQTTTIKVSITGGGQTLSKTVSLSPGDVSLVVEPIASAHPLYAGAPLLPENGTARLVAIADLRTSPTARLDPDTLSYTWAVDGVTLVSSSGVGKSSVVVPAPLQYRNQKVSVVVQSRGGSLVGGDSLTLSPGEPTLRLYVNDPLQGTLFDHALSGQFSILGSETTLKAVPYSYPGTPSMQWFLNGSPAETGPTITLRPQGSGRGNAYLSATARGAGASDAVTAALAVVFGAASTNIFGL